MSSKSRSAVHEEAGVMDGREVEWQLAATDLGVVRVWLADHNIVDGLILEPNSTLQIFDTYLDTDDWRIHRAGFALRVRSESGKSEATLKSLRSATKGIADRRELTETLENSESQSIRRLTGPVGMRVQAVIGAQALRPLFEVRTSRQRYLIRKAYEQQPLGEIALDDTVISRPQGKPQRSMLRVEVEVFADGQEPLRRLVNTLRRECALAAATDSKYSQGLSAAALEPERAPEFGPTTVCGSMPVVEMAQANLRRHLSAWHAHEFGARLGDDPEELHDLRVAARRLDAILCQFKSSLPASFLRVRPAIKKILGALGDVRDLDVALGELQTFRGELSTSDRASLEPLKRHLLSERGRIRARMLSVLDAVSVQNGLRTLVSLLAIPPAAVQQSSAEAALNAVPEVMRLGYRKLRKRADRLTSDSSTEEYHVVRNRVKKLRYALEAVAVIYGKPADEMLRALRRWQASLGVQQDAAVAGRRLTALAVGPPKDMPPETVFWMGRLAEHYAGEAVRARKRYAKGYRKVRGRWRRLRTKFYDKKE